MQVQLSHTLTHTHTVGVNICLLEIITQFPHCLINGVTAPSFKPSPALPPSYIKIIFKAVCEWRVRISVLRGKQLKFGLDAPVSHTHPG